MSLLTNLVSYYKLDESSGNASDSTGNGYTLTNTNVTYAAGKINNGAIFNGAARFDGANGIFPASGDFSMSFWYYGNNAGGLIAGDWKTAKRNIFLLGSANVITLVRGDGGTNASSSFTNTTTIPNNTWTHIVFTQSGTTGTAYLNGSLVGTSNLTYTGGTATGNTVNIGYYNNGSPNDYFTGILDEIGVWSCALTSTDVSQLNNGGAGLQYPFSTYSPIPFLLTQFI